MLLVSVEIVNILGNLPQNNSQKVVFIILKGKLLLRRKHYMRTSV